MRTGAGFARLRLRAMNPQATPSVGGGQAQVRGMQLTSKALCTSFALLMLAACKSEPKRTTSAAQPSATAKCPTRGKAQRGSRAGGLDAGAASRTRVPDVAAPEVLGVLAGPGAEHPQRDLALYGTDLGLTYEHDGELVVVFGDTWMTPTFVCEEPDPTNDDTIATMPLAYSGGIPELNFVTDPNSPHDPARIHLMRGTRSLGLGSAKVAMTAFDDGEQEYAIFARFDPTMCGPSVPGAGVCPTDDGFACTGEVGMCTPDFGSVPYQCDLAHQVGCFPGQDCVKAASPYCFDPASSEHDGTAVGKIFSLAQDTEIGVRRPGTAVYDSAFVWPTNSFANLTARAVTTFTGTAEGNDYAPGHGALLVWGRPAFVGEQGRQAQLHFMLHRLPFTRDDAGALQFEPQYFAGLDPDSGEPSWSTRQSDAKPLALDGVVNGDPSESEPIVNQMSVSWLGPPISKWVMLYGGDVSDALLFDSACTRAAASGAIVVRFADQPWGPWSPARPLLAPGDPHRAGDPVGPGGFLYDPDCVDQPPLRCMPPDPQSTADTFVPSCAGPRLPPYPGRLYGVAIIDAYTSPNGDDGLDIFWNVSTWNPYTVMMVETTIRTPPAP